MQIENTQTWKLGTRTTATRGGKIVKFDIVLLILLTAAEFTASLEVCLALPKDKRAI